MHTLMTLVQCGAMAAMDRKFAKVCIMVKGYGTVCLVVRAGHWAMDSKDGGVNNVRFSGGVRFDRYMLLCHGS